MEDCIYTIVGWNDIYENSRSRVIKSLDWVPVPNKHDGNGYNLVMNHPKAAQIYAAWHLMLQVASKCPVRGVLVSKNGEPYNAKSLSMKTRGKIEWFEEALRFLSSQEVGWISFEPKNEEITSSRHLAVTLPSPSHHEDGTEGNRREGNGRELNGMPPAEKNKKEVLDDFIETIKREYPKRLGGSGWSPKVAEKIKAIPAKEREMVIRGVIGYRLEMEKADNIGTSFIKHISTFFNQECWREFSTPEFYKPKPPEPVIDVDYRLKETMGQYMKVEMDGVTPFNLNAWRKRKMGESV